MTDPLIYTKNGNVPASTVDLHVEWEFGPFVPEIQRLQWIKCREFYTDKATGEIVKDGAHVYSSFGVAGLGVGGSF